MNTELFVQNIKECCALCGVKPTVACRESGAGANLINMLERRGSIPSVEKVQLLAQYLGVSTSELLGEHLPTVPAFPEHPDLVNLYDQLSEEAQQEVMAFIAFKGTQESKAVKGRHRVSPWNRWGIPTPGVKEMEKLKKERKGKIASDSIK